MTVCDKLCYECAQHTLKRSVDLHLMQVNMNFSCQSTSCINQISTQVLCTYLVPVLLQCSNALYKHYSLAGQKQVTVLPTTMEGFSILYHVSSRLFDLCVLRNLTFPPTLKYHQQCDKQDVYAETKWTSCYSH